MKTTFNIKNPKDYACILYTPTYSNEFTIGLEIVRVRLLDSGGQRTRRMQASVCLHAGEGQVTGGRHPIHLSVSRTGRKLRRIIEADHRCASTLNLAHVSHHGAASIDAQLVHGAGSLLGATLRLQHGCRTGDGSGQQHEGCHDDSVVVGRRHSEWLERYCDAGIDD